MMELLASLLVAQAIGTTLAWPIKSDDREMPPVFATVVLAPLIEEMMFRLPIFVMVAGGVNLSVVYFLATGSVVVFSAMHDAIDGSRWKTFVLHSPWAFVLTAWGIDACSAQGVRYAFMGTLTAHALWNGGLVTLVYMMASLEKIKKRTKHG